MNPKRGRIRVGIGGWSYEPWRTTFYPKNVAKAAELAYASRHVTAIEINSTFYRLQTPVVFAKWRDAVPDDFVFTIKAPRYLTHRKALREAEDSLPRFFASGLAALGAKLGPILWQLMPTMRFDAQDMEAFFGLLPTQLEGQSLRHALEVRHESFGAAEYLSLARSHNIATVYADAQEHPHIADVTGDFVYARLRSSQAAEATGYSPAALEKWAARAATWAAGGEPDDLPRIAPAPKTKDQRDVFVFFISGAKERNPAAAARLLELLGTE
jgi:uncharacterized protein YecE (DUF72 family)